MKRWIAFDSEGVRATAPDTGTLEDFGFIREQVAMGRVTRLDESGTIPDIIKEKEVDMTKSDSKTGDGVTSNNATIPNEKIGYFMGGLTPADGTLPIGNKANNDKESSLTPPIPHRRHRRPKGVAPGITVVTSKTAYIDVVIPSRPEGMDKVVIRLQTGDNEFDFEWPESVTALQALGEYFDLTGIIKIQGETNGS